MHLHGTSAGQSQIKGLRIGRSHPAQGHQG
jgi:hypothetical protein